MQTPVRKAFSYGMRHVFIVIQWAMTKSGSSFTTYHTAYTTVEQNMAYDSQQNAWIEMQKKKSVVNHFKNPIEAMVMKEKRLPQISPSLFD